MNKLYYGNGECSIEASEVAGVQIHYTGNVIINDKTSDFYTLMCANQTIVIFPIAKNSEPLKELFSYVGDFKITQIIISDPLGNRISTSIKTVMDYAELLDTKAEDMTIISDSLRADYKHSQKVEKSTVISKTINNLNTNNFKLTLFDEDGSEYKGSFHIYKDTVKTMSGSKHSSQSRMLYYKKAKSGALQSSEYKKQNVSPTATGAKKGTGGY